MNLLFRTSFRFLWLVCLLFQILSPTIWARDDAQAATDRNPPSKKFYLVIPVGPFKLDLAANFRLRHEYQSGFDVRRYEPGTTDHFLLTRIMLDLNLFFWANLRDYEFDLHLNPSLKVKLMIENHYYTLDQSHDAWYTTGMAALRRDAVGLSGRALGDEINIRLSWQPTKKLDLLVGYGHFFPAHFVKATGPANPASGYFLQASYTFD